MPAPSMREEIERILQMQERGELTREEAVARIEALAREGAGRTERTRPSFDDLERSIGSLGREFGSAFARASRGLGDALRPETWVNESNSATFSRTETPDGENYHCEDNTLNLARIARMTLAESRFANNELHAAGIEGLAGTRAAFTGNALRASQLDRFRIEDGAVTDNQCNAARLVDWRLSSARFEGNRLNAAQATDVSLVDSVIRDARWNAVQLSAVALANGSALDGVGLNGVAGRDWSFDDATLSGVRVSGLRINGLACTRARLARCVVRHGDWIRGMDPRELFTLRNLRIEDAALEDCEFVDCRFDDTTFRSLEVSGLVFRDVDFGGMTLTSADALANFASGNASD